MGGLGEMYEDCQISITPVMQALGYDFRTLLHFYNAIATYKSNFR